MDNKKRKVKTVQDDGVPSSAQSSLPKDMETSPKDMETSPTDMETPRWNMWQAAFVLLLYCLVQVILGWDHSAADLSSHEIFFAYIFAQGGKFVLGVGLVWVGLLIVRGSWEQLGVGRFRLRHLLIGLAAGVGLAVVVTVTMNLLAWVLNAPESQPIALALLSLRNPWEIVLLAVCSVVLAPMLEELLFRGMLYPPLRVVCGPRLAVCLVALIFAAFHFDFLRFIPLFVGAVGLTLLLEKTRSLWPGIVAHGVWNLIMVVVVLLQRGNGYA